MPSDDGDVHRAPNPYRALGLLQEMQLRLNRAECMRAEKREEDARFCIRVALAHLDAVLEPFGALRETLRAELAQETGRNAVPLELDVADLPAAHDEPLVAWRELERGYWDARSGRPITVAHKAYMRGYRCGQAASAVRPVRVAPPSRQPPQRRGPTRR